MKKVLFLTMAAAVLAVAGANAQSFNKNDWFMNANISGLNLEHAFLDGDSATTFNLGVGAGYFLSDKFALDAELGIGIIEDFNTFDFGVGLRYYPAGNFFARVGYEGFKMEDIDLASYLGLTVGYDFFVSEKVFFEPAVYYQKNLADGGENVLGLSIGLGVRF